MKLIFVCALGVLLLSPFKAEASGCEPDKEDLDFLEKLKKASDRDK